MTQQELISRLERRFTNIQRLADMLYDLAEDLGDELSALKTALAPQPDLPGLADSAADELRYEPEE